MVRGLRVFSVGGGSIARKMTGKMCSFFFFAGVPARVANIPTNYEISPTFAEAKNA